MRQQQTDVKSNRSACSFKSEISHYESILSQKRIKKSSATMYKNVKATEKMIKLNFMHLDNFNQLDTIQMSEGYF